MAWFKPKGWEKLSKEDQIWLEKAKLAHLSVPLQLKTCAHHNWPYLVRFLLNTNKIKKEDAFQAALEAVQNQSANALSMILAHRQGFDFAGDQYDNRDKALELFQAVPPEAYAVWKILYAYSEFANSYHGHLSETTIVKAIKPEMSDEIFRFHLETVGKSDNDVFKVLLEKAKLLPAEKLKFILTWTEKFSNVQYTIDSALISVVESVDAEKTKLLLEKNADPNYSGFLALRHAIAKDSQEIIGLLRPHLKLESYGEDLVLDLKKQKTDALKIEWLEKAVNEAVSAVNAKKSQENYTLLDADTLSETKQLPFGMTLTTLFNFKSKQQIFIVEKTGEKGSLALTEKEFSDIGDQEFLEAMRLKFVEMGGKCESLARVQKTKLKRD